MRVPFSPGLLSIAVFILWSLPVIGNAGTDSSTRNILVLGDSLSAAYGIERNKGWVALLGNYLKNKKFPYHVVNASVSGDTTRGGLARLPIALKQHKPAIVIIELGGNDGLRGLSLKDFRQNLTNMIALSKKSGARVLLCRVRIPPNMGLNYISRFLETYYDVARQQQVPLVKYILKDVATHPQLMQEDGIHPTAEAQPTILRNVLEELNPLL